VYCIICPTPTIPSSYPLISTFIIDRYGDAIIPGTIAQQALISGLGLVIFGLASYLWMSEYHETTRLDSNAFSM
jgi:hypothetical protein